MSAPGWRACALLVAAVLSGCASAPPVRLHTLVASTDAPLAAISAAPLPISLRVASVPAQVDQPQWLVRLPDATLALLEQERWAAPLRDELRAAVLQRLAAGFGIADNARGARWRVRIDVTRFESLPDREARLDANWSVTAVTAVTAVAAVPAVAGAEASAPSPQCGASFHLPVDSGAPALAEGHRRAAAALADAIGRHLQALARDAAAGCPAP